LVGFCRLRFPAYSHAAPGTDGTATDPVRRELRDAALVRELHVYGSPATFDGDDGDWQHQGYGRRLLEAAEERARAAGFGKLSVISGIGVRGYYREKLDYHQDGPYVSRSL
jgi:Histone acetyltransferase